jgi:hypothetical protein
MTALQGAFRKGYLAYVEHKPVCPYEDKRTHYHRLTWSASFRRAWHLGQEAARHDQQNGDYAGWYSDRLKEHRYN